MSLEEEKILNNQEHDKKPNLFLRLGFLLFALGAIFLFIIFYSSIEKEVWYLFNKPSETFQVYIEEPEQANEQNKAIIAADPNFSVVIPKIGVNSKIIQDVDPFDSEEYQQSLTQGIAHASKTALPGEKGNSFYFAHSSDSFYNANTYNAVFYLLNKLENEDVFYLIFNKEKYAYKVIETKFVTPESTDYLNNNTNRSIATLMTCWPPGTDIKRLVVVGELIEL